MKLGVGLGGVDEAWGWSGLGGFVLGLGQVSTSPLSPPFPLPPEPSSSSSRKDSGLLRLLLE